MPKKKSSSRFKNLPHSLYCEKCDVSIVCPKQSGNHESEENGEPANETGEAANVTGEEPNETSQEDEEILRKDKGPFDISSLTMEEKCDIVKSVFLSEAISISEDMKRAALTPEMTISQIASLDMTNWLMSRHPLLLAVSEGLSKVKNHTGLWVLSKKYF